MKTKYTAFSNRGEAGEPRAASTMSLQPTRAGHCLVHVPDPFNPLDAGLASPIALTDLLADAAIEQVRRTAYRLQCKWYCHEGRDFTRWNDYSLGDMVAGAMLRNQLHGALSNHLACQTLLQKFPDTTQIDIRHDPGIVPQIWQRECKRLGLKLRLLVNQADTTALAMRHPRTLRQRVARELMRLSSRMQQSCSKVTSSRPLAMLVCGSLTLRHTEFCAALDNSPHIDVIRNQDVLTAGQRRKIDRRTSRAAGTHLAGLWDDLQRELRRSELLDEATRGCHDYVISILRDTFLHRLPKVAATVAVARATLAARRPTLMIAEAQAGNDDYVWSSVARSLGIPVASVTNEIWGLPIHTYNFPPAADYVLLPCSLSRPWWLEKGFSDDAVLPVRCRYFDGLNRERSADGKFVVLCTVTRYGPDLMDVPVTHPRRFVQTILTVASDHPDIQFVVKFHPGAPRLEGQASFARQFDFAKQNSPPNVEVAPLDGNLSSYLRRADCLVCSSSSYTVFEALAQGIPCILAPPRSAILDQCPFFNAMKRYSRVTDFENIATQIDEVKCDGGDVPADWADGIFHSEPPASEVVEQLALELRDTHLRSAAA